MFFMLIYCKLRLLKKEQNSLMASFKGYITKFLNIKLTIGNSHYNCNKDVEELRRRTPV